jgi:hypothetical protein
MHDYLVFKLQVQIPKAAKIKRIPFRKQHKGSCGSTKIPFKRSLGMNFEQLA